MSNTSNGKEILDVESILKELDGDEEFFWDLIKGFLEAKKGHLEVIKEAQSTGNMEAIQGEAHSIKGGGLNIMASNLARAAKQLEDIGAQGKTAEVAGSLDNLLSAYEELHEFVKDKLQG